MSQRTAKQAYRDVRAAIDAGRVDPSKMKHGCFYEYEGANCGVGCLFSAEQIAHIKACKLNNRDIIIVAGVIGKKNIEYVTGLTIEDLEQLQQAHDSAANGLKWCSTKDDDKEAKREFRSYVTKKLK